MNKNSKMMQTRSCKILTECFDIRLYNFLCLIGEMEWVARSFFQHMLSLYNIYILDGRAHSWNGILPNCFRPSVDFDQKTLTKLYVPHSSCTRNFIHFFSPFLTDKPINLETLQISEASKGAFRRHVDVVKNRKWIIFIWLALEN